MPQRSTQRQIRSADAERLSYWELSRKPLQVLLFLIPLIIVFELALLVYADPDTFSNEAREKLMRFFDVFGISRSVGLHLGGVGLAVVLLAWHVLTGDPWRVSLKTMGAMVIEAVALAVPLIVMCQMVNHFVGNAAFSLAATGAPAGSIWAEYDTADRLLLSIGAGLYEELMFRMLLIAVLHTLLVDAAKLPNLWGAVIAVILSAFAFAWYHQPFDSAGGVLLSQVAFYTLAGLYFGVLFMARGFGIVVAVHAAYDMIALTLLAPTPG